MVDGVIYMSSPDNAWAVDARDGTILWHYYWKTRGGTHTGNRGMGMWHNNLYLEVHDNYLICLDAKTGKEKWKKEISSFDQQYFSSVAPIVIGDHVIAGTGNDMDAPGFLQSFDPETGERQWIFYTVPMTADDPAVKTWASLDAARHGGGQPWIPGAYDPETHLYMFGTGNPTPAYTTGRGEGDNLYTCSLVAVNVDTGKMAWYYQTSPHDTHDWDSTQTPILADMPFNGRTRKIVMTAERNGYFFVLDRVTGEHLVTGKFGLHNNWALGSRRKGPSEAQPRQGRHHSRFTGQRRRDQLPAAFLLSGDRLLLRAGAQFTAHQLPDRSRSARLHGPGRHDGWRRRFLRLVHRRHRLSHRRGRVAA